MKQGVALGFVAPGTAVPRSTQHHPTQAAHRSTQASSAHAIGADQALIGLSVTAATCAGALRKRTLRKQRRSGYSHKTSLQARGGEEIQEKAFGSWESPITAKFITTAGVGLGAVKCKPDGSMLWIEGRPQEGGRQVVCRRATAEELKSGKASERGGMDVTPKESNVRTRVHEYGGSCHLLGPDGDGVIYSNFMDQRLYWTKDDGSVVDLTPKSAYEEDVRYRFADFRLDMPRNRLICVREDHTNPKPIEVVNTICSVSLDGSGDMEVLAEGRDFFAAPRLSPDGSKLAYICWDHPSMPWDATELFFATLDSSGKAIETKSVCGKDKPTSVLQPDWSPSGELHFIADTTGWWNIYKYTSEGETKNLYKKDAEFSGAAPGWALGGQNYCFLPDGRLIGNYKDNATGSCSLCIFPAITEKQQGGVFGFFTKEGQAKPVEFAQECLPRLIGGMSPSPDGKTLYFLGGDPYNPAGIYEWTVPATEIEKPEKGVASKMIMCSMSDDKRIDDGVLSSPELLKFPTANGEKAYGYYYPPANSGFKAPSGSKPPLLVKAHGGPTACTGVSLNPGIQFWTSRGFAVLDIDYRGSTGYGRAYRERLKNNWGICDIEDVCAGAQYLVKEGLADPQMLAIDGGSAGGYTTLGALAFKDVFKAGCSLYGVADLAALAGDTHKFESRYLDGLVGKYPEQSDIYDARAPIKHVDGFDCPILLLQGAEDKIVLPNQAEVMYEAVKEKGLPCALKIYEGEQHGFRRSENIEDALNSELTFYARIFDFEAAGDLPKLVITNLDDLDKPKEKKKDGPASSGPSSGTGVKDLLLG